MDRIKCITCGAESYNEYAKTDLHCGGCMKRLLNNENGVLTSNILRMWDREKIVKFAKHLLGSEYERTY